MFSSYGYPSHHHAHFSRHVATCSPAFSYGDYDSLRSQLELQQLVARQQERRELEQRELTRRRLLVEQEVKRRLAIEEEVQRRLAVERARREYEAEVAKAYAVEVERRRRLVQHRRQQQVESFLRHVLEHSSPSSPSPAPAPKPVEVVLEFATSSPSSVDGTAEEKEPARPSAIDEAAAAILQRRYRAHLHRREQLSKVSALTSYFESTTSAFTLPESLVFNTENKLAYSPFNAPLLAHEEFLVGLLSKVDEISSGGDRVIKQARKDLVKKVEAELRKVDEKKESELEKHKAREVGKGKEKEVLLEDDTASLPDLLEPTPAAPSDPEETTRLTPEALASVPSPDAPRRRSPASESGSTTSRTVSTLGDLEVDEAVAKVLEAAGKLGEEVAAMEESERNESQVEEPVAEVEQSAERPNQDLLEDSAEESKEESEQPAHAEVEAEEGFVVL